MIWTLHSKYQFWLIQGDTRFRLPVNPTDINISDSRDNSTVSIEGLGELSFIGDPKLKSFSFNFELPSSYYDGCEYTDIADPRVNYAKLIEMGKDPVRFTITSTDINLLVTIDNISYTEKGGDIGTLQVKIKLTEYKKPEVKSVSFTIPKPKLAYSGNTGGSSSGGTQPWAATTTNVYSWLWVRTGPGIDNPTKGKIWPNEHFTVLRSQNGWHYVKYKLDNGSGYKEGWSSGDYIRRL